VKIVEVQLKKVMPRLAEKTAMGTANKSVTSIEATVRYRVFIPTRITSPNTGRPVRVDVPKFP